MKNAPRRGKTQKIKNNEQNFKKNVTECAKSKEIEKKTRTCAKIKIKTVMRKSPVRTPCEPRANHVRTPCKPRANPVQTNVLMNFMQFSMVFRANPVRTSCEPRANPVRIPCRTRARLGFRILAAF